MSINLRHLKTSIISTKPIEVAIIKLSPWNNTVTASAASPDKRHLEPVCRRINELRAHASGRRWGGESLSWMLRAVADSQYSRRSCRYE